jgi:hypothetical protein
MRFKSTFRNVLLSITPAPINELITLSLFNSLNISGNTFWGFILIELIRDKNDFPLYLSLKASSNPFIFIIQSLSAVWVNPFILLIIYKNSLNFILD